MSLFAIDTPDVARLYMRVLRHCIEDAEEELTRAQEAAARIPVLLDIARAAKQAQSRFEKEGESVDVAEDVESIRRRLKAVSA